MLLIQGSMMKTKIPVFQNVIVLLATIVFIIFDYIEGVPVTNKGIVPLDENSGMEKLTLSRDERFMNLYSEMIGLLQDLNVLPENRNLSTCMALDGIRRQVSSSGQDDAPRQVAIVLYFKDVWRSEIMPSGLSRSSTSPICKRRSGYGMFSGLDSDSLKKESGNSTVTKSKKDNNATSALGGTPDGIKTTGLSRTQIAVIVTCAVVLGSFFIIAGALRVRSCLKRYRISREAALSVTRRTSNIGLNGTSLSTGVYRKESSTSKASRQSFTSIKDGSDLQLNRQNRAPSNTSHNSSPSHNHDHTPLLPVRSIKQGSETGSQHGSLDGSLAFIDDESQCKAKENPMNVIESDEESEENPLLRKSPDSGSSIDVTLADVYNVERTSLTSDKHVAEDSESRVSDATSIVRRESDLSSIDRRVSDAQSIEPKASEDTSIEEGNEDGSIEALPEINIINKNFARKRYSFAGRGVESEVKLIRRASLPKKQASVDSYTNEYNDWDYGNNGIYVWPEEDEDQNIMTSHAVNIGLNQSNSSISENPSYSYGNQTEYMYNGGYGNIAYSSPNMNHHLDNCLYIENCECDNTNSNNITTVMIYNHGNHGNGLFPEGLFNKNENLSPSDISSASLSISKDSSGEPLLSQHQHSRTPSNGTNKLSGADNLALTDSGEDEPSATGPAPCTVVSQIVPLAEYHRNSLC